MFHPGLFTAERLFVCDDIVVQACPILALTSVSLCCVRYKYKRTSKVAYHRGSSFHSALQTSVFREGWIVRLFIQADNLSFWVGVTIRTMAPPNVHLVLGGFLIDGVVKVNSVGVLSPVVPP